MLLSKHKRVISLVVLDAILYILLVKSNIVLPFINPSIENYSMVTGFPRNTNQVLLWYMLQIPVSIFIFLYLVRSFFKRF